MNVQKFSTDFQTLVHRIQNNSVPTHPGYTSFHSRLKSFEHFPSNFFQNKYALAECGLKYTGVEDIVECFCCGLILYNWKREDDVWIEHCRYNPKCIYVLLMKGNLFVQKVLSKYCKNEYICNCENRSYDTVC